MKIKFNLHATITVSGDRAGKKETAYTYVSEDGTMGCQFRDHSTRAWTSVIMNKHNMTSAQVSKVCDEFAVVAIAKFRNFDKAVKVLEVQL